jgi:hypothetical protein
MDINIKIPQKYIQIKFFMFTNDKRYVPYVRCESHTHEVHDQLRTLHMNNTILNVFNFFHENTYPFTDNAFKS